MSLNAGPGHKFDFEYLYQFTHNQATPFQFITRPYHDQNILALTYQGCVAAVGVSAEYYSRQDVYERVILWRVPLLALWATTTLPAFAIHTQVFTLVHLIADPIDTIWSLLYKLDLAKRTVRWAEEKDSTPLSFIFAYENGTSTNQSQNMATAPSVSPATTTSSCTSAEKSDQINSRLERRESRLLQHFHDVPASIITAYDEWGYGDKAIKAMHYIL